MNRNFPAMLFLGALLLGGSVAYCDELSLAMQDIRMEKAKDGGYDLWIRQTTGRGSVLLVEAKDAMHPEREQYTLRDLVRNTVNGDERRLLDGDFIDASKGIHSLVDSTTEMHPSMGEAFRIHLPKVVEYGYPAARYGTLAMAAGACFDIRVFALPFADYSGPFLDNSFRLQERLLPKPLVVPAPLPAPLPAPVKEPAIEPVKEPGQEPATVLPQIQPCTGGCDPEENKRILAEMKVLYSQIALLAARTQALSGDTSAVYNLLDSGKLDYDVFFESLDYSIRNNIENGYIIDPRNSKDTVVYISKVFRYGSAGGIQDGDTAYVFRGDGERIGYISFAVIDEKLSASLIELASPDKPLQPFDKIMLKFK